MAEAFKKLPGARVTIAPWCDADTPGVVAAVGVDRQAVVLRRKPLAELLDLAADHINDLRGDDVLAAGTRPPSGGGAPMIRAVTLWQPMAWAIAVGHKRIENRPWRPYAGVSRIIIHAGQKWCEEHAQQIRALGIDVPPRYDPEVPHGRFVAIATIAAVVETVEEATLRVGPEQARWFSGPFGWVLTDRVRLTRAIDGAAFRIGGAQGMWRLPEGVEAFFEGVPHG